MRLWPERFNPLTLSADLGGAFNLPQLNVPAHKVAADGEIANPLSNVRLAQCPLYAFIELAVLAQPVDLLLVVTAGPLHLPFDVSAPISYGISGPAILSARELSGPVG